MGLGLLGSTIPAGADPGNGQGDPEKVTVCHHTGSENNPTIELEVNEHAPNGGNGNGAENNNGGQNGNAGGNGNGGENGNAGGNGNGGNGNGVGQEGECYPEEPGGGNEEPPAEEPGGNEEPPAEEPGEEPVVKPVVKPAVPAAKPAVKPAVKPAAAAPAARAAAAVSVPVAAPAAPNVGYNLETAVGRTDAESPVWLGAATGLFMGFSVLVLWRRREGANKAEG